MAKWIATTQSEIAFDGLRSEEYPVSVPVIVKEGRVETFSQEEFIKYVNSLEKMAMLVVDSWFGKIPEYDGFVTHVTKLADFIGE